MYLEDGAEGRAYIYAYDEHDNLVREEEYQNSTFKTLDKVTTYEYQLLSDYLKKTEDGGAASDGKEGIAGLPNGSIIEFGSYEQDGNEGNGKEPIQWIIIRKDQGKALLLSKDILDAGPYFSGRIDFYWSDVEEGNTKNLEVKTVKNSMVDKGRPSLVVTWEKSDLREWLNSTFYDSAFSEEDRSRIVTSTISTPKYEGWNNGCPDTQDNVFVLSSRELDDEYEDAQYTAYATSKAEDMYGMVFYWLRTNMERVSNDSKQPDIEAYSVYHSKNMKVGSYFRPDDAIGIRPAIWITMDQ